MHYQILIVFMAILASSNWAIAEPNAAVRFLIKEPVTMLEWGFMQLRKDLDGLDVPDVGKVNVSVSLDWDKSQIKIFARSKVKHSGDSKQIKKWCANTIHILRARLGLDVEMGKPLMGEDSFLGSYFHHDGYVLKERPKLLDKKLDSITVLVVSILLLQKGKGVQSILCQAPLLGTEVMYSE